MNSMTGHGRGEALAGGVRVAVECFSVNRKQAEVSFTGPREFAVLEATVREEVQKRIARGKVQVSLSVESSAGARENLIDQARAQSFLRQARALQKSLGLSGEISLETVLAAPGVLRTDSATADDIRPLLIRALGDALDGLQKMRQREGAFLKKELQRVASRLVKLVKQVRILAPKVPPRQRENLLRRLQGASLPFDVLDPRVTAEIATFAERCDISEELARLASHHAQFLDKLDAGEPVGRTLEFLAQEMGREWNTTGAKANDADIARLVVEAKAELDRLREQLANIE